MKQNKLVVASIGISILLVIGAIFLYFVFNPQSSNNADVSKTNNNNLTIQTEDLTDEDLAKDIEKDTLEVKSINELDDYIIDNMQIALTNYISGRYAPVNEDEYNNAMGMHSAEIINKYEFDYSETHENSYALNEDKSVKDIVIKVESVSPDKVTGEYSFNLVVNLTDTTEEINHEGDFTLSTYDNGYLYISEFGDISE